MDYLRARGRWARRSAGLVNLSLRPSRRSLLHLWCRSQRQSRAWALGALLASGAYAADDVPPTVTPSTTSSVPTPAPTPAPEALSLTPPLAARPEPRLPSPWPELAAVFPGFILHGSGTWLQGRTVTTERLLLLEGIGVLTTFVSGLVLFQTGAARDVVGPTALLAVAGVGTFGTSFLANLYATWAPAAGWGEPERSLPLLESSLGYQYVGDPQFDYHHFVTTRLDARLCSWHLGLYAAYTPDPSNQRLELLAGYRLLGPNASGARARDGSYLEPQLGYSEHRFDGSGFLTRTFELKAEGRLDAARILPDVRGAYFQLGAGWAKQWVVFDLPGVDAQDSTSLLLAHMGFGVYVGQRAALAPSGGELELYYDHRHDGFAGGLKLNGLGSGAAGHVGLAGHYYISEAWGLRALAEVGSAWVLGLSALLRVGM